MKKYLTIIAIFTLAACIVGKAYAEESLLGALKEGKFYADVRLRYEFVDQDGKSANANATTARTRLGFKTGKFYNFVGVIEGENVSYLANDNYNDTVNGKAGYPTVSDPENTQVNQGYLEFTGISDTAIKGGRQVLTLDGHRFIGHVGWRQNNQVFDALTITNKSIPDTTVKYGFIYNVNRIFGEQSTVGDWESNSHFYNISNTSVPIGTLTTYGYMLDFGSDSAANSNKTFGGSLSGKTELNDNFTLKYYGEYAYQSDYGDNTTSYSANYYHIAPALVWKEVTTTIGYEVLGSDDSNFAFRTPLATLHKFNGWADKFLVTPNTGLRDLYLDITYRAKGLNGNLEFFNGLLAKLQYHDFNADDGGLDHGNEWGIYLKQPINKNIYVETKYAKYNADNTSTDTQKFIFGIGIKY